MDKINGTKNVQKVASDAAAENMVAAVSEKIRKHLDRKGLVCPEETQKEIHNFLDSSGYTKTSVRKVDWPRQKESAFYMEFSFDETIIEHLKITRKNLNYAPEPATF